MFVLVSLSILQTLQILNTLNGGTSGGAKAIFSSLKACKNLAAQCCTHDEHDELLTLPAALEWTGIHTPVIASIDDFKHYLMLCST